MCQPGPLGSFKLEQSQARARGYMRKGGISARLATSSLVISTFSSTLQRLSSWMQGGVKPCKQNRNLEIRNVDDSLVVETSDTLLVNYLW